MMDEANVAHTLWGEGAQVEIYLSNRILLRKDCDKTPYELQKGRPTLVKHLKVFRSKFYIKMNDEKLEFSTHELMKASFLVDHSKEKATSAITKGPRKQWNALLSKWMRYFPKLEEPKELVDADYDFIEYEDQEVLDDAEEEQQNTPLSSKAPLVIYESIISRSKSLGIKSQEFKQGEY